MTREEEIDIMNWVAILKREDREAIRRQPKRFDTETAAMQAAMATLYGFTIYKCVTLVPEFYIVQLNNSLGEPLGFLEQWQ